MRVRSDEFQAFLATVAEVNRESSCFKYLMSPIDDAAMSAEAKIFEGASWADKAGRMNVRLWTLNLFACHQTKPILLITGLAQSGKTRMAKAIKEILGVRLDGRLDLSVQQVEAGDKGLDAFWATVNDGRLEVFDNLDTKVKWVGDALQNVATDGQTKRRTLYTTFGVSVLRANANIILTSNNPMFSTEGAGGMADRLITVNLKAHRGRAMDTELSRDIAGRRDQFMTWIARTVAAALADGAPVDEAVNRRHPDYGVFSVRCGRAFGDEAGVVEALGAAEAEKALPATRAEVARACRWAALGEDDAAPAANGGAGNPRYRADRAEAAKSLANLEARLAEACAALHAAPDALMAETPARLERMCEAAAVELGRPLSRDEARLRADYDLTRREILRRLKAEKEAAEVSGEGR